LCYSSPGPFPSDGCAKTFRVPSPEPDGTTSSPERAPAYPRSDARANTTLLLTDPFAFTRSRLTVAAGSLSWEADSIRHECVT
jgi:hypothetical protein